jgi:hypothetical protein
MTAIDILTIRARPCIVRDPRYRAPPDRSEQYTQATLAPSSSSPSLPKAGISFMSYVTTPTIVLKVSTHALSWSRKYIGNLVARQDTLQC